MIRNYRPKTEEEKIKQKEEDAKFDEIYLPYVPKISDILQKQLKQKCESYFHPRKNDW